MSVDLTSTDDTAPDGVRAGSESAPTRSFLVAHALRANLPILLLLAGVAILCKIFYQPGHDWGDDFALYIRQAQALVNGNVGEVIAVNRYAVAESSAGRFSPLIYPWGFPLLLAPVVAVWGVSYAKLKIVVIASFLGFLFCLHRLVQRRAGPVAAALLVTLIGSSVIYVGWTSSVTSDFPYVCFAGIALVWLDHCRIRGLFEADGRRDLVILGLLIAFAFSIRRDGLALLAALIAVHGVTIAPRVRRHAPVRWSRIALPYGAFFAGVIGLQLVLPSVLFPHFAGTGTQQIKPNLVWYRDILAEQIGLKDIGTNRIQLLGSWRLAAIVLGVFLALAVVGLVGRLVTALAEDISLIVYLLGAGYIVLTAPFHEGRYTFGITPFLAYFAYQALPTVASVVRRRGVGAWLSRVAAVVSLGALGGLVVANATDMRIAANYHLRYRDTINGPTTPAAVQMEQEVLRCTRGDDVVAFFRARAMTMLTDRRSIQTGDIKQVLTRADWYVMNVGSTYSQPLVDDTEARHLGLRKIWSNTEWVLWLIPGGAADRRVLAC
ncbi:MAG TPA: hypothetical protein VGP92_11940 [Acidimicrobiia bacterium]|jgi:hypothetical protein|nr:hypothetical protein [Acidimicrobiia bacterium]